LLVGRKRSGEPSSGDEDDAGDRMQDAGCRMQEEIFEIAGGIVFI